MLTFEAVGPRAVEIFAKPGVRARPHFSHGAGQQQLAVGERDDAVASRGKTVEIDRSLTYKKDGSRFFPNFDIAWVRLASDAPLGWEPVELLRSSEYLQSIEGETNAMLLAGYGKTSSSCNGAACMGRLFEVTTHLKHFFNEAHFVNLLVIGPNKDHGTCNGDSGGPAFVRMNNHWVLAGILNGKSPLLNSPNLWQEGVCESGEAIYNFAGAYLEWIQSTSGIALKFHDDWNPDKTKLVSLTPLSKLGPNPSLETFLSYNNHNETIWATVETLVNEFKYPERRLGETVDALVSDPALAANIMRQWKDFSHLGVSFDFVIESKKSSQISDIRPIGELVNLKVLSLDSNKIEDTEPLRKLAQLEDLTLRNNYDYSMKVKVPWDFSFIDSLSKLRRLDLSGNSDNLPIYSIGWNKLQNLEELELSDNGKGLDLAAIPWEQLTNLKTLTIRNSHLTRIDALAKAKSLQKLDLSRNTIESIGALSQLKNLVYVDVSMNRISDFSPLAELTSLKSLKALSNVQNQELCPTSAECVYSPASFSDFESYCRFAFTLSTEDLSHWSGGATVMRLIQIAGVDAMQLEGCHDAQNKLSTMKSIDLSSSPTTPRIEDLSPLNPLTQLEELRLSNNDLRDVRPLAELTNLRYLDLSLNSIENLKPLQTLTKLATLDLDGNLVSSLEDLAPIMGLEVFVRN
ncbi:MAG: trypsin-like serine protease, partial [Proteobacteria bacterium]